MSNKTPRRQRRTKLEVIFDKNVKRLKKEKVLKTPEDIRSYTIGWAKLDKPSAKS